MVISVLSTATVSSNTNMSGNEKMLPDSARAHPEAAMGRYV
jgi:hypothetical protein